MARRDCKRRATLIVRLAEKNREFYNTQGRFVNTFDSNSIILEQRLKDISHEISTIIREIRICNIELRRDCIIKEIIRKHYPDVLKNDQLEYILERVPNDLAVRGRSEKECLSKEFEEDLIYFLEKEGIIRSCGKVSLGNI